jgi:two-component system response regulator MtrA
MNNDRTNRNAKVVVIEEVDAEGGSVFPVLEPAGYRAWLVTRGADAEAMVAEIQPDLIVLDLLLPDVDGLVLCADLIARSSAPIVLCSATKRKRDAIIGFKLGAEDFIAKPFDLYDLLARLEKALRRADQREEAPVQNEGDSTILGNLEIDEPRRLAKLGGVSLQLTPTEYRLLATLASRPETVFGRDELASKIWNYDDSGIRRLIDVHVRRLRSKLALFPNNSPSIVSVRGFGYMLSMDESRYTDRATGTTGSSGVRSSKPADDKKLLYFGNVGQ